MAGSPGKAGSSPARPSASPPAAHDSPSSGGEAGEDAPAPLQIDHAYDVHDDADSSYGSDAASANTGSISSSIFHYQYENGRRYHAYREGQYVLPNDDQEQERLNLQHHIWRLLLGGSLYSVPLSDPAPGAEMRVLDLGTGTGVWAIDIADEFPSWQVYGFHVDDYEDDWTYRDDEKFDFIHGRALCGTSSDWPRLYGRIKENLKPGGWVEIQEYDAWIYSDDDSFERAPWTKEWVEKLDEASLKFGRQINMAKYHKQWMIDAGFEDVVEEVKRIPIGKWAKDPALKELGKFELIHMQMSVDSHTPALLPESVAGTAIFYESNCPTPITAPRPALAASDKGLEIEKHRYINGWIMS
ncbi:unnamed protein product [Parascedosporium putredinis]|uniref:Methyltransferase n=1 Tax=Parascedosporium putredinis TaxID=1442378 RepID=A0A9P1H4I5_9PEZI|nr:unnamed protein product [Parascedosporium putredinis]CAI7996785.1 unnamed protein product [Parascedosporium putredinis]